MTCLLLFLTFFFLYYTFTCTCKHKIHNHQLYIYYEMPGNKKNKTINLTKIYKIAILNLKKVNLKSFRDKKEIYGGI